ncbi:hypothetical protein Patl1_31959 [Pistacia atlantica]|uniref:Uncharacterized protein n=1 Tax=Pistacia atlantica TaxID=434234 RepID=A0ACC1ANX3_9ROSI|nr:hypothetical protein Patl1_31959 [Pistacia atlantica]
MHMFKWRLGEIWRSFCDSGYSSSLCLQGRLAKIALSEIARRIDKEGPKTIITRKGLEEEYLNLEAKFLTTLSIVDAMQGQFYMQSEGIYRNLNPLRDQPLEVEAPTRRPQLPLPNKNSSPTSGQNSKTQKNKREKIEFYSIKRDKVSDVTAELEKLDSGFGRSSRDNSSEEIIDWEFDAFDKDLHISG